MRFSWILSLSRCLLGWGFSHLEAPGGRICLQAHSLGIGRIPFLTGLWTKDLSSSLTVHAGCPQFQLATQKLAWGEGGRGREREREREQ
jgi:hypothetical protein